MADPTLIEQLREAREELRGLPLGGRGHLADVCGWAADRLSQITELCDRAMTGAEQEGSIDPDDVQAIREAANGA